MLGLLKQVNLILINILTGASVVIHLIFFFFFYIICSHLQCTACFTSMSVVSLMPPLAFAHSSLPSFVEHLNGSECRHQIIM